MLLVDLPTDILSLVLQYLSARDLFAFAQTCTSIGHLVSELGWTAYLTNNPRPSQSLTRARHNWADTTQVRYDVLSDEAWSRADFIARPLLRGWSQKCQPLLAINSSRLTVAAGADIYTFSFDCVDGKPTISSGGAYTVPSESAWLKNITSMVSCETAVHGDDTLFVGLHDGTLRRVSLGDAPLSEQPPNQNQPVASNEVLFQQPESDFIESLNISQDNLLSLSAEGRAHLFWVSAPEQPIDSIELNCKSWSSHLCMDASTPYAAFVTSSPRPLRVHLFAEDRILPTASVHPFVGTSLSEYNSAVYCFSRPPFASPWGASPQVLISGWFDGQVRCYDLRAATQVSSGGSGLTSTPVLPPVLSLPDPSLEAIYSVSSGGGSATHIAAGSARHSVVSFWDVRFPTRGWSVHAPKNDRSPVYSIILESSRLFGATESRPFIYDFGPDVAVDMYPPLRRNRALEPVGYDVTKYAHGGDGLFSTNEL